MCVILAMSVVMFLIILTLIKNILFDEKQKEGHQITFTMISKIFLGLE